ncbi:MAG: DUF3347 domain-containing protein [Flavobacteriales bacterium]|nr:DUF3347 domain-containing protein [Flavobacteriales bacterium]MEB2341199.1 DUF3347 domain-containing protein [Flavobacteriia bacterium]
MKTLHLTSFVLAALLLGACGTATTHSPARDGHAAHLHDAPAQTQAAADPVAPAFEAYFRLKDALVAGDSVQVPKLAVALDGTFHNMDRNKLSAAQQAAWDELMATIMEPLHPFGVTKGLKEQRALFAQLTPGMLQLAQLTDLDAPLYLMHCPMYPGGADWLSRERAVRNPFYGAAMMTCGSVKEVIG